MFLPAFFTEKFRIYFLKGDGEQPRAFFEFSEGYGRRFDFLFVVFDVFKFLVQFLLSGLELHFKFTYLVFDLGLEVGGEGLLPFKLCFQLFVFSLDLIQLF